MTEFAEATVSKAVGNVILEKISSDSAGEISVSAISGDFDISRDRLCAVATAREAGAAALATGSSRVTPARIRSRLSPSPCVSASLRLSQSLNHYRAPKRGVSAGIFSQGVPVMPLIS